MTAEEVRSIGARARMIRRRPRVELGRSGEGSPESSHRIYQYSRPGDADLTGGACLRTSLTRWPAR
jgi:hypothetical protein